MKFWSATGHEIVDETVEVKTCRKIADKIANGVKHFKENC